ncbi:sensor histidine kinase [Acinetobacter shaoyimingii]|uniref:Alginate biosynthesis protein n=1 Tax=Acinetobacter shaoyimingii TaxID=2715164 RepID=A0A6G8RZ12_9GAMM|nr:histidine kinase [Acinetobacter shaoyimingii]QIO07111.1 alginate biosynthesis protein [Acinetobacter shaoyimingii]
MWSYRLNKMKSSDLGKSITNSDSLAEGLNRESYLKQHQGNAESHFFRQKGNWKYWLELFIASIVLTLLLTLAEAQSWSALTLNEVVKYFLYINWVILVFIAVIELFEVQFNKLSALMASIVGFFLLQLIVILTTTSLNVLFYWGSHFSLQNFSWAILLNFLVLHMSYAMLLGAFCLRYIYVRDEWVKQKNSELNARVQVMQARIHPHFLFNSLNSVVSLIGSDPDKAEHVLIDLSKLFRASFQELRVVSLKEEIELCQQYLAIEKIRLGERLKIEWNIEKSDELHKVPIPLLTLQPLLENSIFHGVEQKMINAKIAVLVEILENQVSIVITNPFIKDKIMHREGNGIALNNVKQRLKAHFGHSVQLRSHAGNGIFTTVVQYQYK